MLLVDVLTFGIRARRGRNCDGDNEGVFFSADAEGHLFFSCTMTRNDTVNDPEVRYDPIWICGPFLQKLIVLVCFSLLSLPNGNFLGPRALACIYKQVWRNFLFFTAGWWKIQENLRLFRFGVTGRERERIHTHTQNETRLYYRISCFSIVYFFFVRRPPYSLDWMRRTRT